MKILFIGKESNPYSRHMIEHLANSNMAKFSVTVVNFVNYIMIYQYREKTCEVSR